jgi:hypothetical protein
MTVELIERELAAKLVASWHLNVAERRAIPHGSLPGSLLVAEIGALVEAKGQYPVDWRLDEDFHGGLIERLSGRGCQINWKAECGVSRYELQAVQEFASVAEAAREYAIRFFRSNFDGIPIDWNR